MKKLSIALFLLITLYSLIFAQNATKLNVIGFSKDGKYLAFERSYTVFEYSSSETFIVNVPKNKWVIKPIEEGINLEQYRTSPDYETISAEGISIGKASAKLKKYNIIEGNTGKLISLKKESIR